MASETVHKSWTFGGIPEGEWGEEVGTHKGREFHRVLINDLVRVQEECIEFLNVCLGSSVGHNFLHRWLVEEMLVNAISHGNNLNPAGLVEVEVSVTIIYEESARRLFAILQVTDEGLPFNPGDLSDPTSEELLERPTGRGVYTSAKLAERRYGHKPTFSVDPSVAPQSRTTGKKVAFQWLQDAPLDVVDVTM